MNTYPKEYRWALGASILVILLSSAPLAIGYASQTPQQRFVGTIANQQDYSVYLAMISYGAHGAWDYQFRFTTEAHTSTYLRAFYVALGHLAGWTSLSPDIIFQVARLGFGLLVCLAIYFLMMRVFPSVNQRRLAFALAILGAGFGWFQTLLGLLPDPKIGPIDLWLIDAYVFFSISLFPHYSATIAALAIALGVFLDHLQNPRWRNIAVIAACALLTQIINPIAFMLADCAMAGAFVFACWQKHKVDWVSALTLCLLAVIQIPLLVYSLTLLLGDPAWVEYNRQSVTLSPPPIYYLWGFGLFWPFAIIGAINAFRKPDAGSGLAFFWVVAAFIMAYMPVNIQRRFLLAVTIPLAILAVPVILNFSAWLRQRMPVHKATGAGLVSGLISVGSFFLFLIFSVNLSSRPPNLFKPAALVQAVDWLAQHGTPEEVALASTDTAQLIAIRAPLRLYFGHPMETLYYADKAREVENFYRGLQPESWLENLPVTWIVFGPGEREWSSSPPRSPRLKLAYQNELVTIYRVISP